MIAQYERENLVIELATGEKGFSTAPRIEVVYGGPQTYIWIGNGDDGRCFATLDGECELRKLAKAILSAIA